MSSTDRTNTVPPLMQQQSLSSAKSFESLLSMKSSANDAKVLYHRKSVNNSSHTIPSPVSSFVPMTTNVRNRVLSARLLRKKTYRNQLAEVEQAISTLKLENRMLKTIHQRQDVALAKYESTNADLPNLLNSHMEELNIWEMKYRKLQSINKDLEEKLKIKETRILSLNDQNKYFAQLNKNKSLEDRERLQEKINCVEQQLQEKEMARNQSIWQLAAELKLTKQQLAQEERKAKQFSNKLEQIRLEMSGYHKLQELNLDKKSSNMSGPGKGKPVRQKSKLSSDFDKELTENSTTDETDVISTQRSQLFSNKKSNKAGPRLNRIMALSKATDKKEKTFLPKKPLPLASKRRVERGDGDAGILTDTQQSIDHQFLTQPENNQQGSQLTPINELRSSGPLQDRASDELLVLPPEDLSSIKSSEIEDESETTDAKDISSENILMNTNHLKINKRTTNDSLTEEEEFISQELEEAVPPDYETRESFLDSINVL